MIDMGLNISKRELKKLKKEYNKEFYANILYKARISKIYNGKECEDSKVEFIDKTKIIMKSGNYRKVIDNLKILYYEKGLNERINNYYDAKIDKSTINQQFLENQKLLLNDFNGEYMGFSSKNYFNNINMISTAVLAAIFANFIVSIITSITPKMKNFETIATIIILIILYGLLLNLILTFSKKMKCSLDKETFYNLCLKAVNELLEDIR